MKFTLILNYLEKNYKMRKEKFFYSINKKFFNSFWKFFFSLQMQALFIIKFFFAFIFNFKMKNKILTRNTISSILKEYKDQESRNNERLSDSSDNLDL